MTRTTKTSAAVPPSVCAAPVPPAPGPASPPLLPGGAGQVSPDSAAGDTTRIPTAGRAPSSRPAASPFPQPGGTSAPAGGTPSGSSAPPAGSTGLAVMAAAMSEDRGRDSLEAHVRRLFRDLGLRAFHPRDSRRSEKGYPDWTITGPGGVMWRELKTQRGRVTAEQQAWLDGLAAAGGDAKVWRPADLLNGTVAAELAALAGRRTGAA